MSRNDKTWQDNGARVAVEARYPGRFIDQHVSPLFYRHTIDLAGTREVKVVESEEQFWGGEGIVAFRDVQLTGFKLSDWFPRAPGVYWSRQAHRAREMVWNEAAETDVALGRYYSPQSKKGLIEDGGIGTIRLRPRRIDGEDCWLATALTGTACHAGIPLAIPDSLIREAGIEWGDQVSLEGRVRFLQDAGLDETAARVHHARPLIVFVDGLKGVLPKRPSHPVVITPVALFEPEDVKSRGIHGDARYTFVQCLAGLDQELEGAVEWIIKYTTKHAGRVITNFDEQRPFLADAPLSYQRLVAKTYDRTAIQNFHGTLTADLIGRLVVESVNIGDIHVGHRIKVGGSAIINIDTVLKDVAQTIGTAHVLNPDQKKELDTLVQELRTGLDKLKLTHAAETKEIADALERAVVIAVKAPEERKKSLLQLSAKGLKDAAELVKDIAPSVLVTASLISKFIAGL